MLEECAEDEEDSEDTEDSGPEAGTSPSEGEESVPTSASSARLRLEGVEEQLRNKLQAQVCSTNKYFQTTFIKYFCQDALQKSLRPDNRVLQNISEEIRGLEAERTELGLHIEQTEAWTQHLGRWGMARYYLTILIHGVYFLA